MWRRFTYRLELVHPDAVLRRKLWEQFLPSVPKRKKDLFVLVDLSDGFSGADIREVCLRLERKQITEKSDATLAGAFTALHNIGIGEGEARRPTLSALREMSPRQVARALRERDERPVQCREYRQAPGGIQGHRAPLGDNEACNKWVKCGTAVAQHNVFRSR